MRLSEKIAQYAYRHWMKKGMTEWPSVRQTARALGIRQSEIEEESGMGDFQTTQYYCHPPEPFGDHSVEAMTPEVEAAWAKYYAHA